MLCLHGRIRGWDARAPTLFRRIPRMQPVNRRPKWLLASLVFSLLGATVTVLLLWTARGRTAQRPPRQAQPREEQVRFEVDANTLKGVLVLPVTPGPHPSG